MKSQPVCFHSNIGATTLVSTEATAATFVKRGHTSNFVVYYDSTLGANGPMLADGVLQTCERDYQQLQSWFGTLTIGSLPFNIYIGAGINGARHASCAATDLFCDAFSGTDTDLVRFLVVAEADEVFMSNQAAGWDCGRSDGEALSRVLAAEIYPNELTTPSLGGIINFATASKWLQSNRQDWIDFPEGTDREFPSIGCGALFINWLHYQLDYDLNHIVRAGGVTLAATSSQLTNRSNGFAIFSNLIAEYFPPGSAGSLTNDNPFPLVQNWRPTARLAVRRGNQIFYQQEFGDNTGISVVYGDGNTEAQYLVGDWTGTGKDTFAVRRGNGDQIVYQSKIGDTSSPFTSSIYFGNGNTEDQYLVGNWTGGPKDKLAVRRGSSIIYQTDDPKTNGTTTFGNGSSEIEYLVGDWTGDGKDKLAVRRGNGDQIVYQTHINDGFGKSVTFGNGANDNQYLVGDWTGDGKDKLAVRRGNGNEIVYQTHIDDGTGVPLWYGSGNEDQYLVGRF